MEIFVWYQKERNIIIFNNKFSKHKKLTQCQLNAGLLCVMLALDQYLVFAGNLS